MEEQKMYFHRVVFHCFKKDSTPENTAKKICDVYGDRPITVQTVRNWFNRFRALNFNLKDEDLNRIISGRANGQQ